ncbi:Rho guanine nucleotide exchange factor 10 [Tupaia chinensis]|uniref:Rho guanine nucleotide exchange factor 10 n=1 Tax=Tupaia chinensis TaxID=246437 RepID=L8YDP3_TUPCH|nr:Rho guanine nucleotide exchange factor 10 [Tupaia chinensis]
MDQRELPPPTPEAAENEVKYDTNNNEEEEGEQFDFDSGDDIPEADRQAPSTLEASSAEAREAAPTAGDENGSGTEATAVVEPTKLVVPLKVNPYSVIDITPFQEDQPPTPDPNPEEEGGGLHVPSGYSVPVPCGYAVPSNLPLLLPAYSSPVIIRTVSVDEGETPEVTEEHQFNSLSSEEPPNSEDQVSKEDSALARWVADPANTAWMDNPEEAIYDDVPRENSDSEPDEMIYDDVENGDEGGNSSLEYGWSSSEFESYEEQSDSECKNGVPRSFLRSSHKRQARMQSACLSHDLTRLKEHYEKKMRELMASTVGAVELQQLKQRHEVKMQKLMKAAREGTKDGLEKTKAAVKRGRSFIRTKSFISQDHRSCLDEEQNVFIDVECRHPEAILTPMPEGLSQQQQYEKPLSEMEPKILSERKLKMVFYRIKEILQCHSMFQIALASRVSEWDAVEMIGDVFVASFSKSMVLDAYSEYVNNFSTAVAVLKKTCATKPAFLEFLKQCQESSPDRTTLYSLMMKPIQRFPQFILLLQLLSSGNRYLIRSDDMIETVYNDRGEIMKTKERRLFMLNDVLMCATVSSRSGRPTFFTAVFNTFTPAIKESWINNLQMAKLALEEENHMGWFCVEDDGNQIKKEKHPLLVGHMPVLVAKQQEFKIECAAYNPEPYLNNESQPDSFSTAHGFLWIGSCTNQMGQIAIVSFQNSNPKVIECFNVESRILCMVYVPVKEKPREPDAVSDPEPTATRASDIPTICLGMEEGR